MKQLSVFSTLLGQAQVAMKIKTELNTGNNILHYMWRYDYVSESNPFVQVLFLNIYSNQCKADSLRESSGAGPLNTGCLLYIGFGRGHHMRSQKFSFTLNKGNKFGTLATDLLKAEFLFLFFFINLFQVFLFLAIFDRRHWLMQHWLLSLWRTYKNRRIQKATECSFFHLYSL